MTTLQSRLHHWRAVGDKIVFTNGCFDILHRGHVELLAQCRELGDHVVLGLNSDASTRRLKGPARPINDQLSRAIVLAGLSFVDAIIIFEEDTPLDIITAINPDIHNGGEVRIIPLVESFSTTATISKSSS